MLPRFRGRDFRTPDKIINLWSELSTTKTLKRVFGTSLKTLFVDGRFSRNELENTAWLRTYEQVGT